MIDVQQQEITIRQVRGPGCIGFLLILGLIGLIAESVGNHPVTWIFIGSLAAAALVAFAVLRRQQQEREQHEAIATIAAQYKACPDCAELIPREARICRFCGYRPPI